MKALVSKRLSISFATACKLHSFGLLELGPDLGLLPLPFESCDANASKTLRPLIARHCRLVAKCEVSSTLVQPVVDCLGLLFQPYQHKFAHMDNIEN